ncbi:MAG: CopG family transcriptional regulator [Denitrovibrio sp.]|nr:MAG: CopG family transcriptional regulator [Denitrovibrio sp.]
MLTVRLPEEVEKRLAVLAEQTGRPKSYYVREAIESYMEDLEDLYTAETVYRRVLEGKEEISALEEVEKRLGL